MLGRLSLAVHRLLSPFCSIFPINKVPGETLARGSLGCPVENYPPFLFLFYFPHGLTSSSLFCPCCFSPCPPGLPLSALSPLSHLGSSSTVAPLSLSPNLQLLPCPSKHFSASLPPYFSCHSPPGFHRSKPIGRPLTVHERCSHVLSRSCSSRCPRWGQDFAGAVLSGPSPCPQLPSTKPSFYLPLPSPSPGSLQRTAPEFARKRFSASPRQLWSLVPPKQN